MSCRGFFFLGEAILRSYVQPTVAVVYVVYYDSMSWHNKTLAYADSFSLFSSNGKFPVHMCVHTCMCRGNRFSLNAVVGIMSQGCAYLTRFLLQLL